MEFKWKTPSWNHGGVLGSLTCLVIVRNCLSQYSSGLSGSLQPSKFFWKDSEWMKFPGGCPLYEQDFVGNPWFQDFDGEFIGAGWRISLFVELDHFFSEFSLNEGITVVHDFEKLFHGYDTLEAMVLGDEVDWLLCKCRYGGCYHHPDSKQQE